MPAQATDPPEQQQLDTNRLGRVALWISLLIAGWIFAATAWICDDAFITFRSVEQLMDGNGPRWNPHDRVQVFTHPLWFAAVASVRAVVGDPALAAEVLSWVLAMATFWLLAREVRNTADRVLLLLALVLTSRAFVDFSSSGLEDPLSHLLLAWMALRVFQTEDLAAIERLRRVAWPAGLLLLCRHDNLWLVAPLCLWLAWRAWRIDGNELRSTLRSALPAVLPLVAWTTFSIVYYGFPFPNTAYAKLNTGIAGFELWERGISYLTHTASWDPMTVVVICVGAILWFRRGGVGQVVAFGVGLHVLYVVRVGGDFMAGRFLTEPFVVCLVGIVLLAPRPSWRPALAGLAAFVVLWPLSPFRIDDAYASYHPDDHHGIADERSFYSGRRSYLGFERRWPIALWQSQRGQSQRGQSQRGQSQGGPSEHFEVGFSAYSSGTDKVVIDRFALADPLLARLPAEDGWTRVGHFKRSVPAGYAESLRTGANRIENPFVHRLYDDLRLVTQGPLFSLDRWAAIWRLNMLYERPGCVDPPCRKLVTHLLPPQHFRPLLPVVDPSEGGVDVVHPHSPTPAWVVVEGRVPFSLLEDDQLVRLFLPRHPTEDSLELTPEQDSAGDLEGFRVLLTFDDPATASRVASALCVAVAADGGPWRLLPRLDASGGICSRLALTD